MKTKLLSVVALAFLLLAPSASAQNTCAIPPAGMVAWWPGDGNTNDIAGGRHGVFQNGAAFAAGTVSQAFSFNGVNYVSVPDDDVWTLGDAEFTIDLWVNFNGLSGRDPFIGHDEGGGNTNKWIFWFDASGHRAPGGSALRFHINGPSLGPLDPVVYPWNPTLGRWYHVAVTRKGSTYTLYIDGVPVISEIDAHTIPNPNAPLTIGRAEAFFLNGKIDEVEITNRALSAAEIAAVHGAGSAGKCKRKADIDIKPGSDPNSINQGSAGVIPVAILSSAGFDATTVVPETIDLAGASVKLVGKDERPLCHQEDVNTDGVLDLVCQVYTWQFLVEEGTDKAVLRAQTSSGLWIWGEDSIRIVP